MSSLAFSWGVVLCMACNRLVGCCSVWGILFIGCTSSNFPIRVLGHDSVAVGSGGQRWAKITVGLLVMVLAPFISYKLIC